jgi:hypothetical protein
MSVVVDGDIVRLSGVCRVEAAEALVAALAEAPHRRVDISGLQAAHTAVIQALLALSPIVEGEPADPFLAAHIVPRLARPLP